jgi:hypothetical protein
MHVFNGPYRAAMGLIVAGVLLGAHAPAATVAVGSAEARAGDTGVAIVFTLTLQPGELVSGIQFDLVFAAEALELTSLAEGPVAVAASKSVSFTETSPGRVRAIVAGLNQNVMEAGVVVEGLFNVPVRAPNGRHTLALENLVLSNPAGRAVPATPEHGVVAVSGGTDPAPPGCGCGTLGPKHGSSWPALTVYATLALLLYVRGKRAARSTASACSRA